MSRLRTRGHRTAVAFVVRAIATEQPPHAVLFVGPDGVGKTTLSLDLAAGLLCLAADSSQRPCRECAACRKVDHLNHPDLHRLAPEGAGQQIRVAQVHELVSQLALLPLEGRFRIAIVEHAQRLNLDAQNALLKTLEEPPGRACLILAADDSTALLATVVSRCARLRLGTLDDETIGEMLTVAGLADRASGAALARVAGGRPGVALALARHPEAVLAHGRLVRTLIDLVRADRRTRLAAQADLIEGGAVLAAAAGSQSSDGDDQAQQPKPARRRTATPERTTAARRPSPAERRGAVAVVISVWHDVARDLAVAAKGGRRELRQVDLLDDLVRAAANTDPAELVAFMARLDGVGRALDAYANPELALDALLLAWPRQRAAAA
ncbi:MAG TPA: DNA polymerase III subunit delta' [Candidatus Limnocylindrales bacterium]|nr:DNA polymerase III subunit delta' [Candidatus Limnocylindrales bacterium]